MSRFVRPVVFPVVAMLAMSPSVLADHIPGHNNADPVFPVPLPDQGTFSGGAVWMHALGPFAGREIVNTVFDITYVSDGVTPASELLINIGINLEPNGVQVETIVTGADLGFGSGPGIFHGSFQTSDLNGIPVPHPFFPPYSPLEIIITAVNGGIQGEGYFVDSFVNFHLAPVPAPASMALLGAAGLAISRRRRGS